MIEKAVIFDVDGVLVDSNEAHLVAFQKLGETLGVPFTADFFGRVLGMHNTQIFPLWLGSRVTRADAERYGERKEEFYRELAVSKLREIPGSVDLVRRVRAAGFKTGVGSSGPRENVALALKTLGIADAFDAVITGSDITMGKPDPEIFLKAAAGLRLDPVHCVVIEDAPSGVQAALAAGMPVIAITTSRPAADLSHATLVVGRHPDIRESTIADLLGKHGVAKR